jgi:hypothetical protein
MWFILSMLAALCFADLAAYTYLHLIGEKTGNSAIINVPLIKRKLAFRSAVLSLVMRHYMSHDANLGYRMKANTKPFRLLHRVPGNKKRFKEVNIKNFFEFRTDNYGFISNTPDQQRDYAALAKDSTIYKILVCGNSVTTGYGTKSSEYNWPAVLEASLNAQKEMLPPGYDSVAVINSSALGSYPVQELRRFQDETLFLNPNLVLLFSAGAMAYDYQGNPVDLGYHDEQKKMNDRFNYPWYAGEHYLLPNLFSCFNLWKHQEIAHVDAYPFRKDGYVSVSAAQYNISKIKQFKGTCAEHGIDFMFFLQPLMGVGKKLLTKQEETLAAHFERYFFGKNWDEYLRVFQIYLDELRPNLTEPYHYDLMDVFQDTKETVYCDPRHHNELGHALLAEKVESIILNHWQKELVPARSLKAVA